MTPEREKEIREATCPSACEDCRIQRELLTEIDSLREKLAEAEKRARSFERIAGRSHYEYKRAEEKLRNIYNQCECEDLCDCSTEMKRIAGEALSKIRGDI